MVQDCLPSITQSHRAKTFSCSHVRLDSWIAYFMQQTHLSWLFSFKSVIFEWERTSLLWSVFYYSSSLSMCISFILLYKNDKHISFFATKYTSFVISCKNLSPKDTESKGKGDYWSLQTTAHELIRMESWGEIMTDQNWAVKIFCFSHLLHLTGETTGWTQNQRCHPRLLLNMDSAESCSRGKNVTVY